jgi:hypothetical protein
LTVNHLDLHAHGLRDYKNVREYDRGVNGFITVDGLESEGRGDLRRTTAFKEIMLGFDQVVLGKIPAS